MRADLSDREKSAFLTIGKVYLALALEVPPRPGEGFHPPKVMVVRDDGEPGMEHLEGFTVVSGELSASWVARYDANGYLKIQPAAWPVNFLWEFYEGTTRETFEATRKSFEEEVAKMESEDPPTPSDDTPSRSV